MVTSTSIPNRTAKLAMAETKETVSRWQVVFGHEWLNIIANIAFGIILSRSFQPFYWHAS